MVKCLAIWVCLYFILHFYYGREAADSDKEQEIFCRERNRPIGSDKEDLYHLVDAAVGEYVILQCHYCNENDDEKPKTWYKSKAESKSNRSEVQVNMENNVTLCRIHVNTEHSLIFRNLSIEDGGYYHCLSLQEQDNESEFNYFLDVTAVNKSEDESGNLTDWLHYQETNFNPINILFKTGQSHDYFRLREDLMLNVEVITVWDPWGECEVCGRPQGEGIRKKKGHCRLKIIPRNATANSTLVTKPEQLLMNSTEISCRSKLIKSVAPVIFLVLKHIPDFEQVEHCLGACNPDAEGKYKGWKSTKKTGYKYRKTFVLAENAHLTIICPESTLENVVEWRRNGRILPAGESVDPPQAGMEPKITVDTFNTLYLHEVTKSEEGNYTCHVDKIRMQQVIVFVVSKSRLLTQALLRHMMYLGFILSLTLTCYFAGLVVTCTRRRKFKTYQEIRKIRRDKEIFSDDSDEGEESDNV